METLETQIFDDFIKKSGYASLNEIRGKGVIEIESLIEQRTQLTNNLN